MGKLTIAGKGLDTTSMAWAATLALRAFGLPFTGLLFIITSVCLCVALGWNIVLSFRNRNLRAISLSACAALLLCLPKLTHSYQGGIVALTGAVGFCVVVLITAARRKTALLKPWLVVLACVVLMTGFLTAGRFHRIFRSEPYESYVSDHFPAGSPEAFKMIESNMPSAKNRQVKSDLLFRKSLNDFRERDTESSFNEICQSLDLDPRNPEAYLLRGKIRLLLMELDQHIATLAIKDFTRAILLDSTLGEAYFRRAMARLYIDHHAAVCNDLELTLRYDTAFTASVREMADSSCMESLRHFFGKLDP